MLLICCFLGQSANGSQWLTLRSAQALITSARDDLHGGRIASGQNDHGDRFADGCAILLPTDHPTLTLTHTALASGDIYGR